MSFLPFLACSLVLSSIKCLPFAPLAGILTPPLLWWQSYGYFSAEAPNLGKEWKVEVIWPASEGVIMRHRPAEWVLIRETQEMYEGVTKKLVFSEKITAKNQWVYNILDGKAEQEDLIYSDEFFTLVPNPTWKAERHGVPEEIQCLTLVKDRSLRSIRDLRKAHVPMLRSMKEKAVEAIVAKCEGADPRDIMCYFHYQPQFYHLHLHLSHHLVHHDRGVERAHLIDDVIDLLEKDGKHFEEASLTFSLKKMMPLAVDLVAFEQLKG